MVRVQHHHRQTAHRSSERDPGLTQALDGYFKAGWGKTFSAARTNPMRAVRFLQQQEGISETGIGPLTLSVLQRYNSNYGPKREPNFLERLFGARSTVEAPAVARNLTSARASSRTAGLAEPARAGVQPAAPQSSGWLSFGEDHAARTALNASVGGRLQPNHCYVVQLDAKNDGYNTASLKGKTYVFMTDASGQPSLKGSFTSSSQPFAANPYDLGDGMRSSYATKGGGYAYPYIRDGVYSMQTELIGATRGMAINVDSAYRDTNHNGRIDRNEMNPVSTALIRFHSAGLGSAGCQTIEPSQWQAFVRTVQNCGSNATYVLRRT